MTMKCLRHLLIAAIAGWSVSQVALASPDDRYGVEVPRSLHVKDGGAHLFFTDSAIASFKRRIAQNAEVKAAWDDTKAKADQLMATPTQSISIDPRQIQRAVEPLTLAYRMTGDKAYARKLYAIFLRLCAQKQWVTDMPLLARKPRWNSDLGMGFLADAIGLGYDSIRDALTPSERKQIADGLMRGIVRPVFADWIDGDSRIHALDTMGHNWWAHIVFGTGVGLVAILQDDPRAAAYLNRIDRAAVQWWNYPGSDIETKTQTFDSAGGYSESVNYAALAIGTYMDFLLAWKQTIVEPPADIALVKKSLGFFFANAYPATGHGLSVNFGDGSLTDSNGGIAIADMWCLGDHNPEYLWYLDQFNPNAHGDTAGDLRRQPRFLVNIPLPTEADHQSQPPSRPLTTWYKDLGWVTMRSSWQNDATLLATRAGMTWNHNHADTGSFVLFHKGKPLLIDSGNANYADKEYDQYYRQPMAHNVVQWDGNSEPPEDTYLGSHLPGRIPMVVDKAGVRYAFDDATGPTSAYFARNFRHFLWIDNVILVIDDLKSYQPGSFSWLLHTQGTVTRDGLSLHVQNGDAAVTVMPLYPATFPVGGSFADYPEDMRLEERLGYRDHDSRQRQAYYALTAPQKSDRMKFLVALIPQNDGPQPVIERLNAPDVIGLRIRNGDKVTDVFLNPKADGSIRHRDAVNDMMGWQTDAYLLAVTYDGKTQKIDRLFIGDGSYLRHAGATLFDSLSKRFLVADLASADANVWIDGPQHAGFGFDLLSSRQTLHVNDAAIALANGQTKITLTPVVP